MKKLDKMAQMEMLHTWMDVRQKADDAIAKFGGERTDTPTMQIDRIRHELAAALKHLDNGNTDSAHLAIRDAIGHCEP